MSNERLVYLDNNATTRVAPEVVEAMLPCLTEHWGNPSSAYDLANAPARMIAEAREQVAKLIGADPRNIVFTSCGTESNNAAIQSALHCNPTKRHVITSAVEHTANIKFCEQLEKRGYEATFLPVDLDGGIDLCDLQAAIRPDTAIVSLMWANNETGVLFPVEELAAICRSHGVLFHTDAIQVAGKLPIDVQKLGVDFLSLSAHKLRAPKGIGLLYVKPGAPFQPYIIGGGQERGQRGGTENVAEYCRLRQSRRTRAGANRRRKNAGARTTRQARGGHPADNSRLCAKRRRRAEAAQHDEHRVSTASRPRRSCCCSTARASAPRAARPAPPAPSSRPTFCRPWAYRCRARKARCDSALGWTTRRRMWTGCSRNCRRSFPVCATPPPRSLAKGKSA